MKETTFLRDFEFCPVLAEMLGTRSATGKTGKVFGGLVALSTGSNLLTLRRLMLDLKPRRTLEIGLSFGGSALMFGSTHRDLGRMSAGQHVALDPFQDSVWDSTGLMAINRSGLSGYLDFRSAFSAFELPKLVERGDQFEMVYVDGSHLFEDVFVDFYFIGRLLAERGIVAFDDSTDPHVNKVIRFARTNLSACYELVDLRPFRPANGGTWRYRMARALGRNQLTAFRRTGPAERAWNASFRRF